MRLICVCRLSSSFIGLLKSGERCCTTTNATPPPASRFLKNSSSGANPPADAPMPTTHEHLRGADGVFCWLGAVVIAGLRFGSDRGIFFFHGPTDFELIFHVNSMLAKVDAWQRRRKACRRRDQTSLALCFGRSVSGCVRASDESPSIGGCVDCLLGHQIKRSLRRSDTGPRRFLVRILFCNAPECPRSGCRGYGLRARLLMHMQFHCSVERRTIAGQARSGFVLLEVSLDQFALEALDLRG
ncbi:MAG: hypothetical protein AAGH64_10035, partial [Planctomycetota bacterium]